MDDINFDYHCRKYEIDRKYIPYLPRIYLVVVVLHLSGMSFNHIVQFMNEKYRIYNRDYTYSRIRSYFNRALIKIIEIKGYAELFSVNNKLNIPSSDDLNKLMTSRLEEMKQNETNPV